MGNVNGERVIAVKKMLLVWARTTILMRNAQA
jgi:hypothetical protein